MGDSLTGQSVESLHSYGIFPHYIISRYPFRNNVTETPLPINFDEADIGCTLSEEIEQYIASASSASVLIYNTGAWWNFRHLNFRNNKVLDLYEQGLDFFVRKIKDAGITLVLRAIFPSIHIEGFDPHFGRILFPAMNRIMKQIARKYSVIYVDPWDLLDREDIPLHCADGLHFCRIYSDSHELATSCQYSAAFYFLGNHDLQLKD